jgi:hypothetical protein
VSKYTIAGLVSWLFSGLILLFQAISSFMGMEEKMVFKSITLVDVVGQGHFNWVDGISWVSIQTAVNYIVTMPLFLLLFCIGILFFLMHMFTSKL